MDMFRAIVGKAGMLLGLFALLQISGCAIGTTRVIVAHEPLDRIEKKAQGKLLVRPFVDKRASKDFIGNKRNGFGMVLGHIGLMEGETLEGLMTEAFAQALREAGYSVVVQDAAKPSSETGPFHAVIDGEIRDFWLDLYMAVWHYMDVDVKALDPASQRVLWEKTFHGEKKDVLWIGATAEYEKVINASLTAALNEAAKAFASEEFARAVCGQ
jgi:hypothetical protein